MSIKEIKYNTASHFHTEFFVSEMKFETEVQIRSIMDRMSFPGAVLLVRLLVDSTLNSTAV